MGSKGQISTKRVRTRRVFYIPGYDPIHPRRYRELYRKESQSQAEISGYHIDIEGINDSHSFGWNVRAEIDGGTTDSRVEVLVWSDIVRSSMAGDIPRTYLQLVKTAWIYLRSGVLFRLMRLRKGPILAALYPVTMLIFQLLAALFIGYVFARAASSVFSAVPVFSTALFWVVMTVFPILILRWIKAKDGKLFAYYLMHDFAHSAKQDGAYSSDLEARLLEFRSIISDALLDEIDEVLIVGHSSGAHLAVSILADLIRAKGRPHDQPTLGFLSLGHVVPMVSFLPNANRLRGDLHFLSASEDLTWVDVTAPGDGCSFALCDPVGVSGVAPEKQRWPLVISAAFTQTLSSKRWRELRWRFFRLHFQYLCAFDQPKDYDYFQITAGPLTLADRYEGRSPSKSRITHAVSKFRSMS